MPFFFFDSTMLLLLPALALAIWAQYRVKTTFRRFSRIMSHRGYTGSQVARFILDHPNIEPSEGVKSLKRVGIESISGELTDHYDPRNRVLRLSRGVFNSNSIAALGVAAHEAGHALQHASGYLPLHFRNNIFPVANLGSWLAFPLFIGGLFIRSPMMMDIAIYIYLGFVVFTLVTLPVEFNASRRAIKILSDGNFLTSDELPHAKAVLNAAALTYVASALMAVMQLVRLLVLRGDD